MTSGEGETKALQHPLTYFGLRSADVDTATLASPTRISSRWTSSLVLLASSSAVYGTPMFIFDDYS